MQYTIKKIYLKNQMCSIQGHVSGISNSKSLTVSVYPVKVSSFVRINENDLNVAQSNTVSESKIKFEIYFKCKKIRKIQIIFRDHKCTQKYILNCARLRRKNLYTHLKLAYKDNKYAKSIYKVYKLLGAAGLKRFLCNSEPDVLEASSTLPKLAFNPSFNIIIKVNKFDAIYLQKTLNAISLQSYTNWQAFIVCTDDSINDVICLLDQNVIYHNGKLKVIRSSHDLSMPIENNNFILFLNMYEIIFHNFLYSYARLINENKNVQLVYSDSEITKTNINTIVHLNLKPHFEIDTLRSHNYIGETFGINSNIINEIFKYDTHANLLTVNAYEIILRTYEYLKNTAKHSILNISRILSSIPEFAINNNDNVANLIVLKNHYKRLNLDIESVTIIEKFYRTKYKIIGNPKVSIIIPNKDNMNLLYNCLNSILTKTTYNNYEIIIVENNSITKEIFEYYDKIQISCSNVQILTYQHKFNYSKVNNYATKFAAGSYFIFLNNDTEIITNSWIEELLMFAQRKDVGIVGAKLLYSNNTIQHAGVYVKPMDINHSYKYESRFSPHVSHISNKTAVTGACIMVQNTKFHTIGGFDENYEVAFSDIDLCMKSLYKNGYTNLYTPYGELYHHEQQTRGKNKTKLALEREQIEVALFHKKWWDYMN